MVAVSRFRTSEAVTRPKRLYPFTAFPGQRGKAFNFFRCMDNHSTHFSDGKILVKDWMYQNLLRHSCGLLFYAQSLEDGVPVPAALLLTGAALGNGGGIQIPDIRSGDPAKRTAIQRGGQIVDALSAPEDDADPALLQEQRQDVSVQDF